MNITKLKRICEAATAGPWVQTWNIKFGVKIWGKQKPLFNPLHSVLDCVVSPEDPDPQWSKDCDFVREARTALPEALRLLEDAREIIESFSERFEVEMEYGDKQTFYAADKWLKEVVL